MTLLNKAFELAFREAEEARREGEIPVGAVVFSDTEIISSAHNLREQKKSPTAHAEILAIEEASKKVSDWRLSDLSIAVTLEPCTMCAGAIMNSRLKNVYFAAYDHDAGAFGGKMDVSFGKCSVCGGIFKEKAEKIIQGFFKERREDDK